MNELHALLKRQIRRNLPGGIESLPPEFQGLLAAVNEAYAQFETDRTLLERALELTTAEVERANSEMRAVYGRLVNSSTDGICAFDRECRYTVWNPALERMTGIKNMHALGKYAFDVAPSLRETGEDRYFQEALDGKVVVARDRPYAAPGSTEQRYYDGHYSPLRGEAGDVIGGLAILRDITERKRAEEALRQARDELEERVQERTAELAAANTELSRAKEAAESSSRIKSQFLANMSHELRTPLNAIIGYSEMLIDDAREQGAPWDDLEQIRAGGKHLLGLINDILDLSKIEAGKMDLLLEHFPVHRLLRDVTSTVRPLIEANHNRLELREDSGLGQLRADEVKVRQMLFNLISNASKFTERGIITLATTRQTRSGADWLVFEVRDTGIGMSAEQMGKLFQPFAQGDASTTRQYGGTGLGLTITKRFCEMMGGRIEVESEEGRGTAFTIHLPAVVWDAGEAEAPTPASSDVSDAAAPPALAHSGPATALIIDDDADARELLGRILARERFRVLSARSGEEGLRLAREVRPHIILLDVLMPRMDGWSVLTALKSDPALADIPVVMISMTDQRDLGYALGAVDYLVKPVERQRLLEVVERHVAETRPAGQVLVVDDDPAARNLLRRALEKDGWDVAEAENGRVALERMSETAPGLILLDLMMPEMDGFEFVEVLRQREGGYAVPIIVVTAKDLTEADWQRLRGGVERVIQKGRHGPDELSLEIHRVLRAGLAASGAVHE